MPRTTVNWQTTRATRVGKSWAMATSVLRTRVTTTNSSPRTRLRSRPAGYLLTRTNASSFSIQSRICGWRLVPRLLVMRKGCGVWISSGTWGGVRCRWRGGWRTGGTACGALCRWRVPSSRTPGPRCPTPPTATNKTTSKSGPSTTASTCTCRTESVFHFRTSIFPFSFCQKTSIFISIAICILRAKKAIVWHILKRFADQTGSFSWCAIPTYTRIWMAKTKTICKPCSLHMSCVFRFLDRS